MQPEIVSREIVKPYSSTSKNNHPKTHYLSFFDHFLPHIYIPLLFFYSNKDGEIYQQKSSFLKISLSNVLSHYYPLAGKIKDGFSVECNDDGAVFLEAIMKCNLSEVLKNPDEKFLNLLLPTNLCFQDSILTGPVAVQVMYFLCGGISIGLCLCHKILDMSSMCSFINDWASLARNSDREISPEFNIGSIYPPLDLPFLTKKQLFPVLEINESVQKRFVFYSDKIAKLKALVADHVPNPTRVEVVSALLHKLASKATAKASSSSSLNTSIMNYTCNLRAKLCPPLSERNIGNMIWFTQVSLEEESEVELGNLVKEFRQSKAQLFNSCANTSNTKELCSMLLKGMKDLPKSSSVGHQVYTCGSWCRFPFYEADFGWGKPLWVATVCFQLKNVMALMDTRGGNDIEAHITLEEKVIAVLEQDEELLSFCSINASILDLDPACI